MNRDVAKWDSKQRSNSWSFLHIVNYIDINLLYCVGCDFSEILGSPLSKEHGQTEAMGKGVLRGELCYHMPTI